MTSRTNHHLESQDQGGPMPVPLSALDLRRQDAIERYLAGDLIETICREMGCSKSWLYKWKNRYEASKPTWVQERSRRPRRIPTQLPGLRSTPSDRWGRLLWAFQQASQDA